MKKPRINVRTKGHSFEREVAKLLRPFYPDARRHLEYQDGEANGVDLKNTGKYKIQCKAYANYAPLNKIEEVQLDFIEGGVPLLITKGNNKPPLVAMPLEHFLDLLTQLKK